MESAGGLRELPLGGWGGWANPDGYQIDELLNARRPSAFADLRGQECPLHTDWLGAARPDVLFEATSLNVETGQPAIDHIRAALEHSAHAITANKGPIVHAYRELRELATQRGKQFLFESTVMDGVPIFSLFRNALPAIEVKGFQGILNSTTNVILTGMEQGLSFDDALRWAQQLGVAETDASDDIEGWDAAVKVAALVNVVMGVRLLPQEVNRQGISQLTAEEVRAARAEGQPYKLVCRAQRMAAEVSASVRPEQVPLTDPMALVTGTSSSFSLKPTSSPGSRSPRKIPASMPLPTACSPISSEPPVRNPAEPRTNKSTITPSRILGQSGQVPPASRWSSRHLRRRLAQLEAGAAKFRTGEVHMSGQVILYFDDQADALRFALAAGSVMAGDGSRAPNDLVEEAARVTRIRLDDAKAEKGRKTNPPECAA